MRFRIDKGTEFGDRDGCLDPGQDDARGHVPRARARPARASWSRTGDPARADGVAVRRRRGVQRAGQHRAAIDTDQLAQSLERPGRHVPQHARRGPVQPARASRALEPERRGARRAAQHPADQRRARSPKVLADRNEDIKQLIQGRRRPAAGGVERRQAVHDLLVATVTAVRPAHRAGQGHPGRPQAGARQPGQRGRPAQRTAGPTSTTACG